ncbi:hypothetical protein Fot_54321 [Forsythia ovata]|uniref:Ubiquitin-like protease family profile domain-containing protein n=1 Tax=Forsythia ovata TaxID=205694 RepID=A0ABD1PGP1_9LAMI
MESDRSKGKGIVNVPVKNRSLGVSGDLTPSILTIKEQHAVSVTPILRRSPRLKIFQSDVTSSGRTTYPKNAIHLLSRAYQGADVNGNVNGPSCFQNIKSCQPNTHQPSTDAASNQEGEPEMNNFKPCCYTKDSIVRHINMIQSTHEKLVADHFVLKFHSMKILDEFGKSIIADLEAVSDFGKTLQGSQIVHQTLKDIPSYTIPKELMNGYIYYTCRGDCGIFVVKYVEYIFMKKINEMPNDFDTGLARHNMAVQLFKYSVEKPDIRLPGIC